MKSITCIHAVSNVHAAKLAGVSEGTIRNAIRDGLLRQYHLGDGRKVVDIRQVLKLYPRER